LEIEQRRAVIGLWLLGFETCHWDRDFLVERATANGRWLPAR
jgi:hypothetical protein